MQDFYSGRLLQGYWRRGIFGVVLFLLFLALLFVIFYSRSSSKRINTSPVNKPSLSDSSNRAYATGDELPQCIRLIANPLKGGARLLVTFMVEGSAVNGVVKNFEFTFGDGQVERVAGVESKGISQATAVHTYNKPGVFIAMVRVKDALDKWSDFSDSCKQTITVEGEILGN